MNQNISPYEYFLPNGNKIDMKGFFEVLNTDVKYEHDFPEFYLDTESGDICEIVDKKALLDLVTKIGDSDRYLLVPCTYDEDYVGIITYLINLPGNPISKKEKDKVKKILADEGWKGCLEYMISIAPEFEFVFGFEVNDFKLNFVEDFMDNFPKGDIVKKFVGCGDCEICKKMKENGIEMNHVKDDFFEHDKKVKKFKKIKRDPIKSVLQIKVSLKDTKPPVWRRFIVPDNYTFFDLHVAIQDVMVWMDTHLHAFYHQKGNDFKNRKSIKIPIPEDDYFDNKESLDEREVKVVEFLKKEKDFVTYEYDFGDGWSHRVELEKILSYEKKETYPQIITGKGMCPWEDSGAIWGFYDKVKILKNKKNEDRLDLIQWLVGTGDLGYDGDIEKEIEDIDLSKFDVEEVEFNDPDEVLEEMMSRM